MNLVVVFPDTLKKLRCLVDEHRCIAADHDEVESGPKRGTCPVNRPGGEAAGFTGIVRRRERAQAKTDDLGVGGSGIQIQEGRFRFVANRLETTSALKR